MHAGRNFPFLRTRVASDGRFELLRKQDLAPGEVTEGWWRAVLANPRPGRTANGMFNRYADPELTVWPTLANIATTYVHVECERCGRSEKHKRTDLIERFDAQIRMVDLLAYLTDDCPKLHSSNRYSDPCGRRFGRVYEWR